MYVCMYVYVCVYGVCMYMCLVYVYVSSVYAGHKSCSDLQPVQRALLIYRTVFACVLWKISRWPFQKSIAQELDSLQCKMLMFVLPCVPGEGEDIDVFCRRRARQARNVALKSGMWSIVWCRRVISWSMHLTRAATYIRALVFCATMTPIGFSDREVNGLALLTIEIQSLLAGVGPDSI